MARIERTASALGSGGQHRIGSIRSTLASLAKPLLLASALLIWLLLSPGVARAGFSFSDFSSTSDLRLKGDATQLGDRIRLATGIRQAGAAWHVSPQAVADGFTSTFEFQIGGQGPAGGDGLAFVIHNSASGVDALGTYGIGIGYAAQPLEPNGAIDNSLAIEFDTWFNSDTGDPNDNHIAVHHLTSVSDKQTLANQLTASGAIPSLEDGQNHEVQIVYEPGTLTVSLDGRPALEVSVDLAGTLALDDGRAVVGFTAGTGGATGDHDILSWSFQAAVVDSDRDGVLDEDDNCPEDANPSQSDLDMDGFGDACDAENSVSIEIQPDKLSCRAAGIIQVTVLSGQEFDATDLDPGTIRFGVTGAETAKAHNHKGALAKDRNGDDLRDIVLPFRFGETGAECGESNQRGKGMAVTLWLTGQTSGGIEVMGSADVELVGGGR